jgi:uncharacterized protein YbbC (DUF1343 family)
VRGDVSSGEHIPSGVDTRTGIHVYSLYGPIKKPTPETLAGVDTVIFDIQEIGSRFHTYTWTMTYVMQACAENKKQFIVLDRPNPVSGTVVEGNVLDPLFASFIGLYPVAIRHGMTMGELALYLNGQFGFGAELEVVNCIGWKRAMWFDQTGLPWVMPSPNMPTPDAALLYSGTCLIEGTNVSEGRGTTKPFEMIGAPWIEPYVLAERLNSLDLPGVRFRPVNFIPFTSKHQGQPCAGVQVHIMDRAAVRSVEVGLNVIAAIRDLHPNELQFRPPGTSGKHYFDLLAGTDSVRIALQEGVPAAEIMESWRDELREFIRAREKYLLYI